MPHDHFDEKIAGRYDESIAHLCTPEVIDPMIGVLAGLAGAGPVLELGIGTGRVALPLARRGLRVHGIDLSPAMTNGTFSTSFALLLYVGMPGSRSGVADGSAWETRPKVRCWWPPSREGSNATRKNKRPRGSESFPSNPSASE